MIVRKKFLDQAFGFKLSHQSVMLFNVYITFIVFAISVSALLGIYYKVKGY